MIEPKLNMPAHFDALAVAREQLLAHAGLEMSALDRALSEAMSRQLDYADLYFQLTRYETWTVEDGIVKEGVHSIDQGIGVRAISGERTGFAYSDQLDEAALLDAVDAARGIARGNGDGKIKVARACATSRYIRASTRCAASRTARRSTCSRISTAACGSWTRGSRRSSRASRASTRSCSCRRPTARSRPTCGRSCASTSR